jgi:hypothetical protein
MAYVCLRYEYTLGHVPPEMKYKKNAQTIAQLERITWSTVGTDLLHLSAQHFWDVFFFKDHEMKMQKDTGDLTHTKHPPINKHRLLNC